MHISYIFPLPTESSRRTRQRGDFLKMICGWTRGDYAGTQSPIPNLENVLGTRALISEELVNSLKINLLKTHTPIPQCVYAFWVFTPVQSIVWVFTPVKIITMRWNLPSWKLPSQKLPRKKKKKSNERTNSPLTVDAAILFQKPNPDASLQPPDRDSSPTMIYLIVNNSLTDFTTSWTLGCWWTRRCSTTLNLG